MTTARLLIDNDVFIVLAAADLLGEAAKVLGLSEAQLSHLGTLPFVLESRKHRSTLPEAVIANVKEHCQRIQTLQEQPNTAVLQLFAATPNVDPGEAVLYTLLVQTPTYLLTSNDKRAMVAIANQATLQPVCQQISGRVLCLETLLLRLLTRYGAARIGTKLAAITPHNTILRAVFTQHNLSHPDQCVAGLEAYHRQLVAQVGPTFLWAGE